MLVEKLGPVAAKGAILLYFDHQYYQMCLQTSHLVLVCAVFPGHDTRRVALHQHTTGYNIA